MRWMHILPDFLLFEWGILFQENRMGKFFLFSQEDSAGEPRRQNNTHHDEYGEYSAHEKVNR